MDHDLPDDDNGDPFHPRADPPVPGKANLHQIGTWIEVMERINDHYDPDGTVYPTPVDHIVHHGRERGVAHMPPADCPADDASRWTPAECRAATAYCTAYLAEHPDSFSPVVPPRPECPYGYLLPWRTVAAFHDACERLDMPPPVAAAVALDAALVGPDVDPADMLANMVDDLRNYGRLGSVIEFDTCARPIRKPTDRQPARLFADLAASADRTALANQRRPPPESGHEPPGRLANAGRARLTRRRQQYAHRREQAGRPPTAASRRPAAAPRANLATRPLAA